MIKKNLIKKYIVNMNILLILKYCIKKYVKYLNFKQNILF